ncbi:MAG: hypothetical protein H0V29_00470, partial [Thermoleophilaceae bacterium]|nr:hypothetical protein [Thermoleophilaceae bacterium]
MRPDDPFDSELRIEVVLFRAPEGDFGVVAGSDGDGEEVIAAGPLGHLEQGSRVRIAGRWQEHPRHGMQVRAELGYELDPDDAAGARKYLLTIRGIGRARAERLIERWGDAVFEAIDGDPRTAFAGVMGAKAAERAADSWRERRSVRELYLLLAPHGAGWLAEPLRARLGPDAAALVRLDPYRLTEEDGVGFATADAIARGAGVAPDSPGRGRAAVVHA